MKRVEIFEEAIDERINNLEDYGINRTVFWAYRRSIVAENDLIDFSEALWDKDIDAILKAFEENDINEFTISSVFSGLVGKLAVFDKNGFKIDGIIDIYSGNNIDKLTKKKDKVPALLLKRVK